MVVFPNAKINLGLNILSRRPDGYHDLDMVMMPVGWSDILEIVPASGFETTLTVTGRKVECEMKKNLVYKAWAAMDSVIGGNLPPVDVYLHKIIPDGAGLGGGSADAAFTLKALNELFALDMDTETLCRIAAGIGADCPFFIYNRPMLCRGTGTEMTPIEINLNGVSHVVIAKPSGVGVSTAEAYGGVIPNIPQQMTDTIVGNDPSTWQGVLVNGFEHHVFRLKPVIAGIKEELLAAGAVYASMSGSGSAVYGLFADAKMAECAAERLKGCDHYVGELS